MSLPEVLLWQRLKNSPMGITFRRQHPIDPYVVDFYCAASKLIIEVDGEAHDRGDRPAKDTARDDCLNAKGYRLARISAREILADADRVAESVIALALTPLHQVTLGPPPHAGEDL